jgi:uncharacterized membrane protein
MKLLFALAMDIHSLEHYLLRLFISPALMGSIFIIVGFIFSKFPPGNISYLYGYRSKKSMSNVDTWNEANSFSGNLMQKLGWISVLLGVISGFLTSNLIALAFITIGLTIIVSALLIIFTEKRLNEVFDGKGLRKKTK